MDYPPFTTDNAAMLLIDYQTARREAVYFHGASVSPAFLGLAAWAVLPVAVIETLTRLRPRPHPDYRPRGNGHPVTPLPLRPLRSR